LSFYGHRNHTRRPPPPPTPASSAGSTSTSLCDLYTEGLYKEGLYKDYKPEYWYWAVVDLVKKLLIVISKNAVSSDWPMIQASSILVVLVVLGLLQHDKSPYVDGGGRGKEAQLLVSLDHFSLIAGVLIIVFGLAMTAIGGGTGSMGDGVLTGFVVMVLSVMVGACLYCSFKYRGRLGLVGGDVRVNTDGMVEVGEGIDYGGAAVVTACGGGEAAGGRTRGDDVEARLRQQLQRYLDAEDEIDKALGLTKNISTDDLSALWRELVSSADPLVVEAILQEVAESEPLRGEVDQLSEYLHEAAVGGLRRRQG
jgi:hypothetical protein